MLALNVEPAVQGWLGGHVLQKVVRSQAEQGRMTERHGKWPVKAGQPFLAHGRI